MPTIASQLSKVFADAIAEAFNLQPDANLAGVGVSQQEQFGDYQSNAAMSLAKTLGQKPREVAEKIKANVEKNLAGMAEEVTIAGPGFINVRLLNAWLAEKLQGLLGDERLGVDRVAQPQTVVVDYSGPNVAKEMHVGHLRSTIIGDAISRVLEFQGNIIIRQNHIGDWGTQFGMLIAYLEETADPVADRAGAVSGALLSDLEAFYRAAKAKFDSDPRFADEARKCVVRLQSGDYQAIHLWKEICLASEMHYGQIYRYLDVRLSGEHTRGESTYNSMLPLVVDELTKAGIAQKSEGAIVVPVPGYEAPLIIQKSDGAYLYGTTDLAAIRYRAIELHANQIIYTHDSRQQQHFAQVFWTADKAGWIKRDHLHYAPFGTMLGEDGKPFKTRTGGTVKLKDLLDEAEERAMKVVTEKNPDLPQEQRKQIAHAVGIGGVKYSDLAKDRLADYVFSFDKMLSLDGNTAPYLQYAHARIRSIFRKVAFSSPSPSNLGEGRGEGLASSNSNSSSPYPSPGVPGEGTRGIILDSPFERALAKHILRLGEVIELVARELKPHYLCTYLYELATKFSGFYENCPVIQSAEPMRSSRLLLCELTARTLERGLDLLGIQHPDQM